MSLLFISKEKHEAEVSRQAMEACEQIISEMGAELHDDLIQRLSILRLSLDRLERSLSDKAETQTLLTNLRGEFQEVIQSVRKISRKLLPVESTKGTFQQNLALLCQSMERPGTGTIHFESHGQELPLPEMAETYLSRIVQELIHNAYKHSSAWHVWVRLAWRPEGVTIEVEDDGTGFSKITDFIELLRKKHGTLRMRSHAIGANLHYDHGQNGLLATAHYPFSQENGS